MTFINDIKVTNFPLTAFGDLRTSSLSPIFQISYEYTVDNTEILTNTTAFSGSVTQANGMISVSTGTTATSIAQSQTVAHAKYRSGFGGLYRFTTLFTSPVDPTEQLVGLADEQGVTAPYKNGYMIGYFGTSFGLHRFANDTRTTIDISAWDDPLDGTGESGMTIDLTKLNVWEIRFQYLGAGAITLNVEDDSTGELITVHTILYSNLNTTPSTENPNFSGTIWVDNGNTTNDIVVKSASQAFLVEGKNNLIQLQQPQFSSELLQKTSVTTETAIFTIRNKSTYNSKANLIDILLEEVVASIEANSANNLGEIRLVKNATLGGSPSYSDINTTDSIVDIDTSGTTVTGGKTLLTIPLAGKNDRVVNNVRLYAILLRAGETLTIAGSSANSATIDAALLWKELF